MLLTIETILLDPVFHKQKYFTTEKACGTFPRWRPKFSLVNKVNVSAGVRCFHACKMRARLPCMTLQFFRGMALFRSSGYIGGKWKDCDAKFPVYNPATGEEIGRVSDMGRKDAEEAVTQAYKAFNSWKNATANVGSLIHDLGVSCLLVSVVFIN